MVGADAREGVGLLVVWQAKVAHLGVQQAVHQPTVAWAAATDAGADRQVDGRVQALRRTPTPLAERGGIDIGVKAHWDAQRPPDDADQVGVRPARFGRRGDGAVIRRVGVK